jgi:PAS domain S-box-containing protein
MKKKSDRSSRPLRTRRPKGQSAQLADSLNVLLSLKDVVPDGINLLEVLIQASPVAISITDSQHKIRLVNPAFTRIFGYQLKECLGQPIVDLIVPADEETIFRMSARKIIGGATVYGTLKRRHKNGAPVYVETYAVSINSGKSHCGDVVVYNDVTERVTAEQGLRQSEEVFRMLSATAPVGIFCTDEYGTPTYVNQRLTELTGITSEQSKSNRWAESIHPDDRERTVRLWNDAVLEGDELVDQHRVIRPDGDVIWVAVRARWARTPEGKRLSFVGIVEDVTGLKAAHEHMKLAKEAAEAASRAKGEFLANMSHEIRTPLNGIIGMTELTLETDLTPDQREYLDTVKFSADSLLTVINDILDFSKIEAGKLEMEAVDFDLGECLGAVIRTLWLRATEKHLELGCKIAKDVPAVVCGDPTRLTQVAINLLGNAIKFTEMGRVSLEVQMESSHDKDLLLHFIVCDTGIGIPPEKQELIFAPFTQADTSTTRRFGGTGLGLSISMRLVQMMGGKIWLESKMGTGTRFHFTAQFRRAKEQDAPAPPCASPARAIEGASTRVLVVDDNPVNQALATKLLEKRGYLPTVANNGRQAVTILQNEAFEIVLMDVQMPEMDGFEATAEIRKREAAAGGHQFIVAVTAHAMKGDRERCLDAGMDSYLTKPIRPEALDAVLGEYQKIGLRAKSIAAGKQ